jgi:RraA family protein
MSNVGFRVFTKIERAPKELIERFANLPTSNIADNMGRLGGICAEIKPYNKVKLLGTAVTVRSAPGDNLMFHKAIDLAQPGDVIVVDAQGFLGHSVCGEIMIRHAISRGIKGFVVDGAIRDVEILESLQFSVYAKGVTPRGPYKNGPGEVNVPVNCGGIVVQPGDIVVGDADGIVIISPKDAAELADKTEKIFLLEQEKFKAIANGTFDRSWVDKSLAAQGCEII